MWVTMWAALSLAVLAVAAAHAAPTSAIVGGLETSLLDGRTQGQDHGQDRGQDAALGPVLGRPTTARLERVYSSSVKASDKVKTGVTRSATESYTRTGNRVHLTPAGTLSENPAPCAVGGRHFLHGQQVTRPDPCEFCMCLDGEVFCWWQDCPPSTAQGPCRGRPAFSSCQDDPTTAPAAPAAAAAAAATTTEQASAESDDSSQNDTATASPTPVAASADSRANSRADATSPSRGPQLQTTGAVPAMQDPTTNPQPAAAGADDQPVSLGTEAASAATGADDKGHVTSTTAGPANATTTSVPTTTELMCHVLGSTYRVGEVLPRDTGSCLQCECSPVGRVTCSPKDCLSVREEEDVYQPASSLDMFDVDSF